MIGVVARLVNAHAPKRRVYIISDDSDFTQLLDHPTTTVLSQCGRSLRQKIQHPPHVMKLLKIYQGDRPDNIEPAFPRCGPKTAIALYRNPTS